MPVNDNLVPFLTCTLTATIVCLDTILICCCLLNKIIVIIIVLGFLVVSGHCYDVDVHYCRYWYWVLVSLEANIGYWILGAFLGIVLTLHTRQCNI